MQGKKWMPCAYYSRQLQSRESRYSSTEMEALAMLSAIEHFDHYLIGTHFTVYTDHQALLSLFKSTTLNNRLWRWRLRLSNFSFQIVYIAGKSNVVADALSRQGWPPAEDAADTNLQEEGDVVESTTFS